MSRPSNITRLMPRPLLEEINKQVLAGRTIDEMLARLRATPDAPDISRSALGRHRKTVAQVAERLRYARDLTAGLRQQMGDVGDGEQARLNAEMLQTQITEAMLDVDDGEAPDAAKIESLAKSLANVSRASKMNQEFVAQVEKRAEERIKRTVAAEVEKVTKARGISSETAELIKAAIFGVKPEAPVHA